MDPERKKNPKGFPPGHWTRKIEAMEASDTRSRPWKKTFGNQVDREFGDKKEIVHVGNNQANGGTIKFSDYDVQANGA